MEMERRRREVDGDGEEREDGVRGEETKEWREMERV